MISWFCLWHDLINQMPPVSSTDLDGIVAVIRNCRGLVGADLMVPTTNADPHYKDQTGSPSLVLQIDFASVGDAEESLAKHGPLSALIDIGLFPSLAERKPIQEAMLGRRYPLARAVESAGDEIVYLVTYDGPADNEQAWHSQYVERHRVLLSKFPGLRRLEIYTNATAIIGLPIEMARSLQRNKTAFGSADEMASAMASPVRAELRQDFADFPHYQGAGTHFPFVCRSIRAA